MATKGQFVSDIEQIRKRAREHIEEGAVTPDYGLDRNAVCKVLNDALATEIVCVLRYKHHYFVASGLASGSVADEFAEHAVDEQKHADQIAERITELGGDPNFNPEGLLSRSHSEYREGVDLVDMIKEDLIAERIAIESYREIITWLGQDDPTTRRLMEEILAKEEEHASDMADLLARLGDDNDSKVADKKPGQQQPAQAKQPPSPNGSRPNVGAQGKA